MLKNIFMGVIASIIAFYLTTVFSCSSCSNCSYEVPFNLKGKLHIFNDPSNPTNAGLPKEASTYIIGHPDDSTTKTIDRTINLDKKSVKLKRLRVKIRYEYHADTSFSQATLGFEIKNAHNSWKGEHSFKPDKVKKELNEKFEFNIPDLTAINQQVQIEVKPIASGDFGFYIYDLNAILECENL